MVVHVDVGMPLHAGIPADEFLKCSLLERPDCVGDYYFQSINGWSYLKFLLLDQVDVSAFTLQSNNQRVPELNIICRWWFLLSPKSVLPSRAQHTQQFGYILSNSVEGQDPSASA